MKTTIAAIMLSTFVLQVAPSNATTAMDCWGLQGQALKDCSAKLADELASAVKDASKSKPGAAQIDSGQSSRTRSR